MAAITTPLEVGGLLRAIEGFEGHPLTAAALRLLPHVFVRPGELRFAEWADFDLDKAVRDDPDAPWTRRALAGASVGIPTGRGFQKSDELLSAIVMICNGIGAGKERLGEILSAKGDDYQRCLWFALAGRDPWSYYFDLQWLVHAMRKRMDLAASAKGSGFKIAAMRSPYRLDQPDGPQGTFSPEFTPSLLWDGFT